LAQTIRILLVEDHELTRQGFIFAIKKFPGFEVVGEAIDGKDAIEKFKQFKPEVVLMDIALPVINGIEAAKQIKDINHKIKIIMLTSYSDQEKVFGAFSAGASAYCLKAIKTEKLLKIIEIVCEGGIWFDPAIADYILKLLPYLNQPNNKDSVSKIKTIDQNIDLTEREKEILNLIAKGLSNKDIASKLSLSVYTVKNHVSSIISKLAVDDRTQAAILALKRNLL
jgi:DNA-binding NarL/FixJ family response regulator